ncbi:hypothetical protein JX265_009340 [Neoarthrinium moseri]|uniref:Uncharacterized protein n=1 Tax=Neoarthrinium moseri TaxID=1658444 RepID=A0A9P9WGF0_9PEZI|nr:hypothetical protein JX265_009340 [Neoarthrinium moseri]
MHFSRSVIVTGGTTGIGYQAALTIARAHPDYLVIISSRSDKEDAATTINRTLGQSNTVYKRLDLSNSNDVRQYAKDWASGGNPPIQALVLNAGLQFPNELKKTDEGLEATFAINHVGHALLFHLLAPQLADQGRVVVTSSGTHDPAQKSGLPDAVYTSAEELARPSAATAGNSGLQRYSSSKLANVLWAYALHRHLQEIVPQKSLTVNAFDPGLVPGTMLGREHPKFLLWIFNKLAVRAIPLLRFLLSTPNVHLAKDSGRRLARLAVGADVSGVSGRYFEGEKEIKSSKDSYDEGKQEDLWNWTVKYLANGNATELVRFQRIIA